MSHIQDPQIANIVYNFLGNTLAQLNEIDKHNVGGSSLKALKTDPKNVFRVNADQGMALLPSDPVNLLPPVIQQPQTPVIPQATVPAAPAVNVVNAGLNVSAPVPVQETIQQVIHFTNGPKLIPEFDKIISALTNIKNILNESVHDRK